MADKPSPTPYVVLREVDDDVDLWQPFGNVRARSGEQAIKQAAAKQDGTHESGRYKAVPVRTWESDVNNLVIRSEVKPVSLFERPGARAEQAQPEPTPED